MGILDVLGNFRDLFEVGRKTTSDVKPNKSKERNYSFNDGEKMPATKSEYKKSQNSNGKTPKNKAKDEDDLEL